MSEKNIKIAIITVLNQVKENMLVTNEKTDNLRRQVENLDMLFLNVMGKGEIITKCEKLYITLHVQ